MTAFYSLLDRTKWRLFTNWSERSLECEIANLFQGRPATLVKVGANDGVQGDPLCQLIRQNPQWTILFIEPIKGIYERLVRRYSVEGVYSFENVAIAEKQGRRKIYYVSDAVKLAIPEVPFWYDQLGSFDRNHILKHGSAFEPFIATDDVQCETLPAVLEKHGLTSAVDLVHIDTEGYDFEVLKQVDLSNGGPRAILYEHKHLSGSDRKAAEKLLLTSGYAVKWFPTDTLAVRRSGNGCH